MNDQVMTCEVCGCTEFDACLDGAGQACHWVSQDPPLCSACVQEPANAIRLILPGSPEWVEAQMELFGC